LCPTHKERRQKLQDVSDVVDLSFRPHSDSVEQKVNWLYSELKSKSFSRWTALLFCKTKKLHFSISCECMFGNLLSPLCDCRFLRAAEWPGDLIGWWRVHADCWWWGWFKTQKGERGREVERLSVAWQEVCMSACSHNHNQHFGRMIEWKIPKPWTGNNVFDMQELFCVTSDRNSRHHWDREKITAAAQLYVVTVKAWFSHPHSNHIHRLNASPEERKAAD